MRFIDKKSIFLIGSENAAIRALIDCAGQGTLEEAQELIEKYPDLIKMGGFSAWQEHTVSELYYAACISGDLSKIDFITDLLVKHAPKSYISTLFTEDRLPCNQACKIIAKSGNGETCVEILRRFGQQGRDAQDIFDLVCDMYRAAKSEKKESTVRALEEFYVTNCRDELSELEEMPQEFKGKLKTLSDAISLTGEPDESSSGPKF